MNTNKELEMARFIIEKTRRNLFLTGKAGTGKTTFLRDISMHTSKKMVVLAPTGVAAINAGAMTIHSFFQFGLGPYIKGITVPRRSFNMHQSKIDLIKSLDLMVIDEISMVRADLLDHINDELQRIRGNRDPFGGVQMVMIGDLQQLPPVAAGIEGELLPQYYDSTYFFDSRVLKHSKYDCIELQNVYRHNEQQFIEILNRARDGVVTDEDVELLNERYCEPESIESKENYIRLVTHNQQAEVINEQELASLEGEAREFEAEIKKEFNADSFPTSRKLVLKVGAQVMFVKNDPEKAFVNGSIGVISEIGEEQIEVYLPSTDEIIQVGKMTWEDVRYKMNPDTKAIEAQVKGSFTQFPLKPAWAITVHKSQGLTFERAIIDVSGAFSPGQAYVALSRCRSLQGLILRSRIGKSVFLTDSKVKDYLERAMSDLDKLAQEIGYEPFDYDRPDTESSLEKAKGRNDGDAWNDGMGHDDGKGRKSSSRGKRSKKSVSVAERQSSEQEQGGSEDHSLVQGQNRVDDAGQSVNPEAYEALRKWRAQMARTKCLPPYCIFDNKTLDALVKAMPATQEHLRNVWGMGPNRVAQYGQAVLDVLNGRETVPAGNVPGQGAEGELPGKTAASASALAFERSDMSEGSARNGLT